MNYLKVDTENNNTINDVSSKEFIDLLPNEIQVESNFNFPTSQPFFYYKWNIDNVEINDEKIICDIFKNIGALSGLDLEPFIDNIINGDFMPYVTKEIIINGINFSPFSIVEIENKPDYINEIYFDSPNKLRVLITVDNDEGKYNVIVKNNDILSEIFGHNKIIIKSKTVVDLRTISINDLGLEMTNGVSVQQDSQRGLKFSSSNSNWYKGVKFGSYYWNREDEVSFEIIFTIINNVNFMIGIGSTLLNVNNLNTSYYEQEIGMFQNNNKFSSIYGGGDVSNWHQDIGFNYIFELNKYYKLKLKNSGGNEAICSISEIDLNDWNDESNIYSWTSNCPADDEELTPFVIPYPANGGYYITGFRY